MICDFCSAPLIADDYKSYEADDFVHREVKGVQLASAGKWCACPICADMVDKEQWNLLILRSVNCFFENNPDLQHIPRLSVWEQIMELHGQFRQARHGKV